ncbi:pepsin/retropepsin-like aspartic protease family protein [uncultured Algibacter sp.]|uniref:pepsin/retropepsin-like aspartic protease family protein n=1 Tax=uncultured Algibacter sp. TaxID=298659 RepID=UPI0026366978|nr:PDZ domain-containing protein [uncultured Algibacter sp.]
MKKYTALFFLFFCISYFVFSQNKFVVQNKQQSDKIKFKLINNLIIIPVEVNGVTLSFLLDTGVSKPIIFNFLNVSDTLKIKDTESIFLRGLGEGDPIEALKSRNNVFKVGDAIKLKQELYAVYNINLNLSPKLGFPVHGIIGFDLFEDLVVQINYSQQIIILTEPEKFEYKSCRGCEHFGLVFHNKKPYIKGIVEINNKNIPVKLLIDSGSSDALWLFEDSSIGVTSGSKFFEDFLGHGLAGSVYGKRSKVQSFSLKRFKLKNVNVSFPESKSIVFAQRIENRNGSLSGNILKRFNIIFNYKQRTLTLKKNKFFNESFGYNKSGIELAHDGSRLIKIVDNSKSRERGFPSDDKTQSSSLVRIKNNYRYVLMPAYVIVELREKSPAKIAGLKVGDLILSINGKDTKQFSLQQINQRFYDDAGKRIKLKVDRDGQIMTFSFFLKQLF